MRSLVDRLIDRGVIPLVCLSVLGHSSLTAQEASPRFHHLHLNSTDPAAAIEWYTKTFPVTSRAAVAGYDGIASEQIHLLFNRRGTPRKEGEPCDVPYAAPTEPLGVIRSPAATVRFGEISLIIYPRQRPGSLTPSPGHVVDHLALAVTDLAGTLKRLEGAGVKVLRWVHPFRPGPGHRSVDRRSGFDSD
jgi:catechol 2,3-dioxygenase-like lactoylglutathione lyase family enzyme